jgi:hypothetical protein
MQDAGPPNVELPATVTPHSFPPVYVPKQDQDPRCKLPSSPCRPPSARQTQILQDENEGVNSFSNHFCAEKGESSQRRLREQHPPFL